MNGSEHGPACVGGRSGAAPRHGRFARWFGRARRRGAGAGLAALDERMLRDIGLTRREAEDLSR